MEFEDRRIYWVWLTMVLGAGNDYFWQLCRGFQSISDFAGNVKECRFTDMTPAQCKRAETLEFEDAQSIITKCEDEGIDIVTIRDERYPRRLKKTPNPPPVLFVRGDISALNARSVVSVVGTRTPCDYSLKAARVICEDFSRMGVMVVSGAETGIDVEALEGALDGGTKPTALLGRGIIEDHAKEGVAENCILLAEYTNSADYTRVSFNSRNRILCGLSDFTLFIEARADSKGLNNVKHSERLHRPVFCVPPADIFDPRFNGQQKLLLSGAQPAFGAEQILKRYGEIVGEPLLTVKYADVKTDKHKEEEKTGEKSVKKVKKVADSSSEDLHNEEKSAKIDMSGFTENQKLICGLLEEKGTLHLNQIAEMTELSVSDVMNELIMLSIEGKITELPGKCYKL